MMRAHSKTSHCGALSGPLVLVQNQIRPIIWKKACEKRAYFI